MSAHKTAQAQVPEVYAARTNVGCVREHNEDSFIARTPLFVVADGMGGHEAGEVASEIAINTMLEHAPCKADGDKLIAAVKAANRAILLAAAEGVGRPGMGTTITAAQLFDDQLLIAQVGDSRAYLLHEGHLQRVTRDHSLVADLVEQGRITEEEARVHPQRSVITRALGSDPHVEPDLYILRVEKGDRLLLCSDGLSGMVTDAEIEALLREQPNPQACCDALVDEALAGGGLDNVTVVVVDPLQTAPRTEASTPARRHLRSLVAPIVGIVAFLALIAAACAGIYLYAQNSYYLIDEDGYVSLYQGLPGSFAGVSVNWLVEKTDIPTSALSSSTASRLEGGQQVDSYDEAQATIESYRQNMSTDTANGTAATGTQGGDTQDTTQTTPAGEE